MKSELRLTIQSRLEEVATLWPWAESIAEEQGASAAARFAVHLCLEEAISNIVRHGYRGQQGHPVTVAFSSAPGELVFTVEDQAPPFDPLAYSGAADASAGPLPHASSSPGQIPLGGQGIRLMRKFAGSLAYRRFSAGNRLTMRFPIQPI